MLSSGMLCRVALVKADVSQECVGSIIRVTRIGEIGTTSLLVANVACISLILSTLMKEVIVPPKCVLLQEPRGVTSQKTALQLPVLFNKIVRKAWETWQRQ
jgi:hypothetical protein